MDARFGDFRIAVPREHRAEAVAALAGVRMSVRAIAKLLGVGVGTMHRELVQLAGVPNGTPESAETAAATIGRDGKSYPRHRVTSIETCSTCGERHLNGGDCPWDCVARGVGPRPAEAREVDDDGVEDNPSHESDQLPVFTRDGETHRSAAESSTTNAAGAIALATARIEALSGQVTTLPRLLDDLERAIALHEASGAAHLAGQIRIVIGLTPFLEESLETIARLSQRITAPAE